MKVEGLILALTLGLCLSYGWWCRNCWLPDISTQPPAKIRIALIQGNFDPDTKWSGIRDESVRTLFSLTKKAAKEASPDLTIWTETAIVEPIDERYYLTRRILGLASEINSFLLVGAPYWRTEQEHFNSAFLISPEWKIIDRYDKIHLVPFGEAIPAERFFPWLREILPSDAGDWTPGDTFTIFNLPEAGMNFGVLICYEGIFGDLARQFVRRGADFLVNITNDAWSKNPISHEQHFSMGIFRAIENRCYFVRAGNAGVSAFINPLGEIEKRSGLYTEEVLISKITKGGSETIYTKWGDVLAWICLLGTAVEFMFVSVVRVRSIVLKKKILGLVEDWSLG
ncbi:MAG: apolipoprotein N-acyltransferase, partial [bacterium]|nr:apolipoprotein N-acyltransferase [bacterium]